MTILSDYLDDLRRRLHHLDPRERDAAMAEIRAHLQADIQDRQADGASADEAALQATEAFGEPGEIAVAYGPEGGVVKRTTGEVLLRVAAVTGRGAVKTGAAIGRGTGTLLKWTGITAMVILGFVAVFLVIALVFADEVLDEFGDEIKESIPRQVLSYETQHSRPSFGAGTDERSFQIGTHVKEFRVDHSVQTSAGCAAIRLISPSGATTEINGQGCEQSDGSNTFTEHGTWRMQVIYGVHEGTVDVEVWAYERADR